MKPTVAILAGGGPAPGINAVIGSIAKVFIAKNYRVIGIQEGYKGLLSDEGEFVEIDFAMADQFFIRGGSVIQMSRFKPKDHEFNTRIFQRENIALLVTIGGDDTASTANRLAKYLQSQSVDIRNIHVPKTIDNDLPLPAGIPTFGYNSAKDEGVRIAKTIYEDARTSGNWFVLSSMGRSAGHLAFEIGAAAHFPMLIVPEMFTQVPITGDRIVRLSISSILKRKALGLKYGAISISEGVFHFMTDEEIAAMGTGFTFDVHGHPELYKVSKSHLFGNLIEAELKALNIKTNIRPVELGFEMRCATPIAYDLHLCTLLGIGVYDLFATGHTGCMVMVDHLGKSAPIYLKDVEDEHGKIPPRLLDIQSGGVQAVINHNLHYVCREDYAAVSQWVENPAHYDFRKILGLD